ncbi:MAG: HAMP domain-containing protein [Chloroflexi bacterium]|nr:HAMP domain-containing protein [Chloroflexota bacterium]
MNTSTPPARAQGLGLREFLFSQLRVKITLPYLILAIILAVVVTFTATQILARDLEERFTRRLIDSGQLAADTIVKIEREQLALLRTIVFTEGFGAAAQNRQASALKEIAQPLVVNARADLLEVVDLNGDALFVMHRRADATRVDDYLYPPGAPYADWKIFSQVAAGQLTQGNDKFADIVSTPWGNAFYTAGPLKVGDKLVGVLLVGTYLDTVARRIDKESLARVSIYAPSGDIIATTLTTRDPARARIAPPEYARILKLPADQIYFRPTLTDAGTGDFTEAFGAFEVRDGEPIALFSVAASHDEYVSESGGEIRNNIFLIFGVGIAVIAGIGVLVARGIVQPVTNLVAASQRVAEGDLEAHVDDRGRDEIGLLGRAFNRMTAGLKEREFIKDIFGRVVSKEVREVLIQNFTEGGVKLGGELRQVTMIFIDIRDFTSLAERYEPSEIVAFLNEFFTEMLEVVGQHQGLVNKFGGDSTLIVFGAPVEQPDHARRAVECAIALRQRLAEFNARRHALRRGIESIRIGIGINTGPVIAGQIGSLGRFEYTVIGDAVNLTSRIQGLNKNYPEYNLLISEMTYAAMDDATIRVKDLGLHRVKGKEARVRVYAVLDEAESDLEIDFTHELEREIA